MVAEERPTGDYKVDDTIVAEALPATVITIRYAERTRVKPIEPKIKPLVDALNDTGLLVTFSSCQGHYNGSEQKLQDRNFADVRFRLLPDIKEEALKDFLRHIVSLYYALDTATDVDAYKKYISSRNVTDIDDIYLIKITPKRRFDQPKKKRIQTDLAVEILVAIVRAWISDKNDKRPSAVIKRYPISDIYDFADYIEKLKIKFGTKNVRVEYGSQEDSALEK